MKVNYTHIARTLGLNKSTVSRILRGQTIPQPRTKNLIQEHYPEIYKEISARWPK